MQGKTEEGVMELIWAAFQHQFHVEVLIYSMLMVEMPTWIEWEKYTVIFVNLYV